MIKESIKLKKTVKKYVTRICDECGKEERARMMVIIDGRRRRKAKIDLCRNCSNSSKYKPKDTWKKSERSHLWKGGRRLSNNGVRIHIGPKRWIYEHRLKMGKKIKRKLETSEIVHHVDGENINNNISNLYLFSNKNCHRKCHAEMEKIGLSLFSKSIWFDRDKFLYSLKFIFQQTFKSFNLDFLNHRKIKIYNSKNKYSIGRSYKYCNSSYIENNKKKYKKEYIHTIIMEKYTGYKLLKNKCVHHIDGNGLNNNINNLIIMNFSQHAKSHRSLQKCVCYLYKKGIVKFRDGQYYV